MERGGCGLKDNINALKAFWSDIKNVEWASDEDMQRDILAYLKEIERLYSEKEE
jgi:hypothetical protein